ncbi:hypothetical protein [Brucella sp.]|uniref:hypothetical protein n=1 Tax=Brucella sp. TaxID=52132 RepID=UPI0028AA948C|nr:hypothetical protein [Brucella sp.]
MTDLITRLSKLTGPRYTMDVAIALATDFWPKDRIQNIVYNEDGDPWVYFTDGPDLPLPPAYTASVDAAIALAERVLPGWGWEIASNTSHIKNCLNPEYGNPVGKHPHWAVVANQSSRKFVDGATPAIALLIALLRAKEASKP